MNLGLLLGRTSQASEAVDLLERRLAQEPTRVGAHLNRGNALQNLSRYDEALAHDQEALRLQPDPPGVPRAIEGLRAALRAGRESR